MALRVHLLARLDVHEAMGATVARLVDGTDDLVVCARADRPGPLAPVTLGGPPSLFPLARAAELRQLLAATGATSVHLHGGPGQLVLGPAALAGLGRRLDTRLTVYAWPTNEWDPAAVATMDRSQLAAHTRRMGRAAAYRAVTPKVAASGRALLGTVFTPDDSVTSRVPGASTVPFGPSPADVPARAAWSPSPKVLFMGRAEPSRGVHVLLDAFPAVRRALPSATLTLALLGYGERPDAPSRLLTDRLGHPDDRPDWLEVVDTPQDVSALLASSQLLVLPFLTDHATLTPNLSALEAAAHGLPTVVSDVACLRPCAAGGAGALVPPGHPAALATAVVDMLADRHRWQSAAAAALDLATHRGGWDAHRDAVG